MRITLALAFLLVAGCGAAPPAPARPTASGQFVVPTELPNGRVEITVSYRYPPGSIARFPVAVSATRGSITGPVAARVNATGFGNGAPAEVLLKTLVVSPLTVSAGQRLMTAVSWDGQDERGEGVPPDYYVLVLDFQIENEGVVSTAKAATTIELRGP
jgi:hypothetical protein